MSKAGIATRNTIVDKMELREHSFDLDLEGFLEDKGYRVTPMHNEGYIMVEDIHHRTAIIWKMTWMSRAVSLCSLAHLANKRDELSARRNGDWTISSALLIKHKLFASNAAIKDIKDISDLLSVPVLAVKDASAAAEVISAALSAKALCSC